MTGSNPYVFRLLPVIILGLFIDIYIYRGRSTVGGA